MASAAPRKIVAVVPLYRPGPAQIAALQALATQVDHVVAVDDGSRTPIQFFGEDETVTLVRSPDNVGIARCLNIGVLHAREIGATHVLTVDQDSSLPADYVSEALAVLGEAERRALTIGAVGAGRIGPHRVDGTALGQGLRDGTDGVQSGWVIPVQQFDEVGLFDESLFIDCVDVDFIVRSSIADRPIAVSDRCVIGHALGTEEHAVHILGRRVVFSYHPPFRRYYITRNRITMLRRYLNRRPRAMSGQTATAVRIALLCLVAGPSRRAQLTAIWAGTIHGVAGRGGRIPARVLRAVDPSA